VRGISLLRPARAFAAPAMGLAFVLALAISLGVADAALAVSPVGDCRVLLRFGAPYGQGSVHRGLDLATGAGAEVCAPVEGTVVFVGAVPADGGGTVIAVSVDAADGTRTTVMPLESASVKRGAAVGAGQAVGTVTDAGDASHPATHIHLSLRRGSVYLDPAPLLGAAGTTPDERGTAGVAQGAGSGSAAGAAGSAASGSTGAVAGAAAMGTAENPIRAADTGLASGMSLAPKPAPAPVPATAPARASVGAGALQSGVVVVGSGAVGAASERGGLSRTSPTVVHGLDIAALFERAQGSLTGYARRHVRALVLGVGALLAGVAALTPLGKRAGSGEAVCTVRPEGDAVAAAAGR